MTVETKTNLSSATIKTLQKLIKENIDSRDGFHEAADHTDDLSIRGMFEQLGAERDAQAAELQRLVAANAEQAEDSGSVTAAAHRVWMDLRAALGGGATAMLSEAERGEDHIKELYEEALKEQANSPVADVLRRQYAAVKADHDRVRDLRDHYQQSNT